MMRKLLITKAHKLNRRRDIRAKLAKQHSYLMEDVAPHAARRALQRGLIIAGAVLAMGCASLPTAPAAMARGGNHGHHSK
jgi:hypothetical protein